MKNLLLDGFIDFEEYKNTKFDLEEKIILLEDVIDKNNFNKGVKADQVLTKFMNPFVMFSSLQSDNKHRYLNCLFKRNWKWDEFHMIDSLQDSAKTVYGKISKGIYHTKTEDSQYL